MELVASGLTFIEAASSIAKLTVELCQLFQDAPAELVACKTLIEVIRVEAHFLQKLSLEQEQDSSGRVQSREEPTLTTALNSTYESISFVDQEFTKLARITRSTKSKRARIHWVLIDRPAAERLFTRLQRAEASLSIVLQLQSRYLTPSLILTPLQIIVSFLGQTPHIGLVNVP